MIHIPLKRVIVKWATIPPLLNALDVINSLVGVTLKENCWYIDAVQKGMNRGQIRYIGDSGSTDYEKLLEINPDMFFAGEWENTKKLKELAIPFAVVTEYREHGPLARLEWIKFFAAFYNKEAKANVFFDNIVRKVKKISSRTSQLRTRPKVLWGFITGKGQIYVPGGNSYISKMIELAGGNYIFKDIKKTGGSPITMEEFYRRGRDADIYISPVYSISSIRDILSNYPVMSDLKPIRNKNVWRFQPWYWQSISKTDMIIEDLAAILHPQLFPGHRFICFQKVP